MPLSPNVFSFYWSFLKNYKGSIAITVFFVGTWTLRETLNPYIIKMAIDRLALVDPSAEKLWLGLPVAILVPILWYLFIQNLNEWSQIVVEIVRKKLLPGLKKDIRLSLFDYVQNHSTQYFQDKFSGAIANKISLMGPATDSLYEVCVLRFIDPIIALTTIFILFTISHPFYSIVMIVWLFLYFMTVFYLAPRVSQSSQVYAEAQSVVNGQIVDAVGNIFSIKSFARQEHENRFLSRFIDDELKKEHKHRKRLLVQSMFQKNLTTVIVFSMICVLLYNWSRGLVTPGDFALVLALSLSIGVKAHSLGSGIVQYYNEAGRVKEALSLIAQPHGMADAADAQPLAAKQGEIRFDRVGFSYNNHIKVFEDLSLHIRAGEKVGLVGESGAGKSTFVKLLLRFHDINHGTISIDGQDVSLMTQASLRENVALIPQDTALFNRSLMENIRYGRLDASDDEVIEAAIKAHAHDFISRLSAGYNTEVGERGVKLSGGQRQRIAIARAILKNAKILVLDEATSALDSDSEYHIQESLKDVIRDKTVVAIAHRLSTLALMDRIVVFEHGRIAEEGSHDMLLAKGGIYAHLWAMQSGGFIRE